MHCLGKDLWTKWMVRRSQFPQPVNFDVLCAVHLCHVASNTSGQYQAFLPCEPAPGLNHHLIDFTCWANPSPLVDVAVEHVFLHQLQSCSFIPRANTFSCHEFNKYWTMQTNSIHCNTLFRDVLCHYVGSDMFIHMQYCAVPLSLSLLVPSSGDGLCGEAVILWSWAVIVFIFPAKLL